MMPQMYKHDVSCSPVENENAMSVQILRDNKLSVTSRFFTIRTIATEKCGLTIVKALPMYLKKPWTLECCSGRPSGGII